MSGKHRHGASGLIPISLSLYSYPMKTSLLRLLAFAPLASLCLPVHGADFHFLKGNGEKLLWTDSGYWVNGSGNPYSSGVYPGAGDTVMGNYNGGTGVPSLYLNGDRTIRTLLGDSISSTDATNTRIYAGHSSLAGTGAPNTLTVTEAIDVRAGIYYFYSGAATPFTVLNIATPTLRLGTSDYTNTTTDIKVARVQFGSGAAGNSYVNFSAQQTIFAGVASRIMVGNEATAARSNLSFGHVTFDILPTSRSANGFELGTGAPKVTVASIHSTSGSGGDVYLSGTGTLVIDPNSSNAVVNGVRNYSGTIRDSIAVQKKGDSLQVFSAAAGNTYSGGTDIVGGVLAVRNSTGSGLGTGAVAVGNGGTLAGGGRIALSLGKAIVVARGGAIAPGEANRLNPSEATVYETLTIANTELNFQNGAAFNIRVALDGSSDRIAFSNYQAGQLVFGNEGLAVNVTGNLADGGVYTLFTFANGAAAVSSNLSAGLFANSGFDGFNVTFHYDEGLYGGNGTISMSVEAIPEPGVAALLLPLLGGIAYRSFRNRSNHA